jgi:hypothetical protein
MSWSKNQKQRDRQARQRERLRDELNYYKNNTFSSEDQETITRRIVILERELNNNGIPKTYR